MSNAVRIAVVGGPKAGKTTLARTLGSAMGCPVRSTDDVMKSGWSESSEIASHWFDQPGGFVIEGVATVRALRKWLARNPTGKPCDIVVYLDVNVVPFTKDGQAAMGKGCAKVWKEIEGDLIARGVEITKGRAPGKAA